MTNYQVRIRQFDMPGDWLLALFVVLFIGLLLGTRFCLTYCKVIIAQGEALTQWIGCWVLDPCPIPSLGESYVSCNILVGFGLQARSTHIVPFSMGHTGVNRKSLLWCTSGNTEWNRPISVPLHRCAAVPLYHCTTAPCSCSVLKTQNHFYRQL